MLDAFPPLNQMERRFQMAGFKSLTHDTPSVNPKHLKNLYRDAYYSIQYKENDTGYCYADMEFLASDVFFCCLSQAYKIVKYLRSVGLVFKVKEPHQRPLLKTVPYVEKNCRIPMEKVSTSQGRARKRVTNSEKLTSKGIVTELPTTDTMTHEESACVVADLRKEECHDGCTEEYTRNCYAITDRTIQSADESARGIAGIQNEGNCNSPMSSPRQNYIGNGRGAEGLTASTQAPTPNSAAEGAAMQAAGGDEGDSAVKKCGVEGVQAERRLPMNSINLTPRYGLGAACTDSIPHPTTTQEGERNADGRTDRRDSETYIGQGEGTQRRDARLLSDMGGRNHEGFQRGNPSRIAARSNGRTVATEREITPELASLTAEGVPVATALAWITLYGLPRVRVCVDYLRQTRAKGHHVPSPGGFLRRALEENWPIKLCDRTPESIAQKAQKARTGEEGRRGYHLATAEEIEAKRQAIEAQKESGRQAFLLWQASKGKQAEGVYA